MPVSSRTITIRLSPWISENEAEKVTDEVIARLRGRVSVDKVREELGIKPGELVDDLEAEDYSAENLRRHGRERLPRPC